MTIIFAILVSYLKNKRYKSEIKRSLSQIKSFIWELKDLSSQLKEQDRELNDINAVLYGVDVGFDRVYYSRENVDEPVFH